MSDTDHLGRPIVVVTGMGSVGRRTMFNDWFSYISLMKILQYFVIAKLYNSF